LLTSCHADSLCGEESGNRCSSEGTCTLIIRALITWGMYTDHQGTNDQCSPSSATCQCPSMPTVSAHQCHLPVPISASSMPHISAYQCTSMPHSSAHLSCLSLSPIS
ncbi:unnamed protein product, partial [Staurois parvus]